MAGREGFEPSREFHTPYPLSRRVLSTTQPPPRGIGVVARFYPPRPLFHTYPSMEAPGGPGAPPMWGPGRKMAFGAAPGPHSKLWYTLVDGNLSEVFFPTLDRPALHELRFFAAASGAPPVDDAADAHHTLTWVSPGVPAFTADSTHHEYRLTKEFFSDPAENAMLITGTFTPELPDVRLFM